MERSAQRYRAVALAQIDQEKCRFEVGAIREVGLFGTPACVKPYPDAGRTCSDKSECVGLCKAPRRPPSDPAQSAPAKGTPMTYGCFGWIKDGVFVNGICAD